MKETEWAQKVSEEIQDWFPEIGVATGRKLAYASEIIAYGDGGNHVSEMPFETDILLYEAHADSWQPRVVIETKIKKITTHDAITYSQKAAAHKFVHPYLRYGIFIGKRGEYPLPGRLFRHGAHFDFMISWQDYTPADYESSALRGILKQEIEASRKLEEMLFNSRSSNRQRYYSLHRLLVTQTTPAKP